MEIGSKIRNSRTAAGITQEQAAEALGVSRQTVSNWENGKTYPDIVSVLKMSDLYHVSLDYLLKGEEPMKSYTENDYVEFLEESTNTVKSRDRLSKRLLILAYLVIWAVAIVVFWFFTTGSDAMGYSLVFLWVVLPVTTFVISLLIGRGNYWGSRKWFGSIVFGVMYMLAEYATFSTANNVTFHKLNRPELGMIISGAVISLAGMAIGYALYRKDSRKKQKTEEE